MLLLKNITGFTTVKSDTISSRRFPVQSWVRKGGVVSPYLFNSCIQNVLSGIRPSYFHNLTDASNIAFVDDLLVLSWTKSILVLSVQCISVMFWNVCLSLKVDKCERLVFNPKSSTHNSFSSFSVIRKFTVQIYFALLRLLLNLLLLSYGANLFSYYYGPNCKFTVLRD